MVLWPCPPVHLGQLAPTTLPQCRLLSNPRSAGLFLRFRLGGGGGGSWVSAMMERSITLVFQII